MEIFKPTLLSGTKVPVPALIEITAELKGCDKVRSLPPVQCHSNSCLKVTEAMGGTGKIGARSSNDKSTEKSSSFGGVAPLLLCDSD
ncbi:hypothetical protein PoB_007053000 [Plakobranchus ocellatus]|uniref:Uncharacterized protein n=1 Tax=Plakobranchus ocellatus TaxID=259542 RepID=A0AAV4DJ60_9GAST|nr:hypothetical protein PoB_007053000 [Plakobranchus ocellatus]